MGYWESSERRVYHPPLNPLPSREGRMNVMSPVKGGEVRGKSVGEPTLNPEEPKIIAYFMAVRAERK
jgi:hypothetical protein